MSSGWFKIDNAFIDDGALSRVKSLAGLKVLLVLRRYEDKEGVAWPSLATIARLAGTSRGHAARAVSHLVRDGLVVRLEPGRGPKRSTRYFLPDAAPGATVQPVVMLPPAQHDAAPGATQCCPRRNDDVAPGAAQQRPLNKTIQKDQRPAGLRLMTESEAVALAEGYANLHPSVRHARNNVRNLATVIRASGSLEVALARVAEARHVRWQENPYERAARACAA